MDARMKALNAALDDLVAWLQSGTSVWGCMVHENSGTGECAVRLACSTVTHMRTYDMVLSTACVLVVCVGWPVLCADNSQVAILDGTNSTEERRKYLVWITHMHTHTHTHTQTHTHRHTRTRAQTHTHVTVQRRDQCTLADVILPASLTRTCCPVSCAQCDATMQRQCFHGKWQYLMIETVCSDPQVLHENYMMKMRYSPDYKGVDVKQVTHRLLCSCW